MDPSSLEWALAKLPASYEPLLLTFLAKPSPAADGSLVIGADGGTELRVDVVSGAVHSVDSKGDLLTMNAGIRCLVATHMGRAGRREP